MSNGRELTTIGNDQINNQILILIFGMLDEQTLKQAFLVNKTWQQLARETLKNRQLVWDILAKSKLFPRENLFSFRIEKLKNGLTNHTFKVSINSIAYVVRVAGEKTEDFIKREHEYFNARITSEDLKISPQIFYFDTKTGSQITEFLEDTEILSERKFKNDEIITATMELLYKLNHYTTLFINNVNVFDRNKKMLSILEKRRVELPRLYADIEKIMDEIRLFFPHTGRLFPSHNDATPSNFLKKTKTASVKIIDLEYSANNDIEIWDMIAAIADGSIPYEKIKKMIKAYYGKEEPIVFHKIIVLIAVYEYWCSLWAHVQIANKNLMIDPHSLAQYENEKITHCQQILQSDTFLEAMRVLNKHRKDFPEMYKDQATCFAIVPYGYYHMNLFSEWKKTPVKELVPEAKSLHNFPCRN